MSEQEFELYLKLLSRCLNLTAAQREQIADELRDHLQERLEELSQAGVPREKAVVQALEEFGDAAVLAADFASIARLKRRRFLMRLSLGSVAAVAAAMLVGYAFWPENHAIQGPGVVIAQEKAKPAVPPAEKSASKPAASPHKALVGPDSPLSSDRAGSSKTEQRISEALDQPVDFTIDPQPLREALDFIGQRYQIPILLDTKALEDASIEPSTEVKINVPGIKLRSLLKLLLDQLPQPLTYVIEDDVMKITTVEKANELTSVVVYDCRDLVNVRSLEISESQQKKYMEQMMGLLGGEHKSDGGTPKSTDSAKDTKKDARRPLAPPAIPLIRVLQCVAGMQDDWDKDDDRPMITEFGGLLIVRQTQRVHEQIKHVLADIRRMKKDGAFANLDKDHGAIPRVVEPTYVEREPPRESARLRTGEQAP